MHGLRRKHQGLVYFNKKAVVEITPKQKNFSESNSFLRDFWKVWTNCLFLTMIMAILSNDISAIFMTKNMKQWSNYLI